MRREIEQGFETVKEGGSIARIVGTPARMIESWALGDREAFVALGYAPPKFRGSPEDLWGEEHEPSSSHPKRVLERALHKKPTAMHMAELAAASRPDEVARSCPDSFRPFLDETRDVVARCAA
jgi:hypothetical protein